MVTRAPDVCVHVCVCACVRACVRASACACDIRDIGTHAYCRVGKDLMNFLIPFFQRHETTVVFPVLFLFSNATPMCFIVT